MVAKVELERQTDKPTELKVWGVGLECNPLLKTANSLYKVAAKVEPDRQTDKPTELKVWGRASLFLKRPVLFRKWLPRWSRTDRRTNPPN